MSASKHSSAAATMVRRAVVTGAGSGIGKAIAAAFSRSGVKVAAADLNFEAAKDVAAEIGNGAIAVSMDVSSRSSVEEGFGSILDQWGGFEILAANAGVSTMNRAADLTDEEWDFNFNVNARGVFLCNQTAVRHFLAEGKPGTIVNTASLAAKVGFPLLAHYSASKFAVLGWTQALGRELAPHNIRVNAVCPGYVKTSMQSREIEWEAHLRGMTPDEVITEYIRLTPLGRLEEPEEVADVVVFLASDGARFMTGQGINVTGGIHTS